MAARSESEVHSHTSLVLTEGDPKSILDGSLAIQTSATLQKINRGWGTSSQPYSFQNNRNRGLQMRNQYGKNKSSARPRNFRGLILGVLFLGLSATLSAQQILAAQQMFDPATSE